MSVEQAASAFQEVIQPSSPRRAPEPDSSPVERLFAGEHDESEEAGGDLEHDADDGEGTEDQDREIDADDGTDGDDESDDQSDDEADTDEDESEEDEDDGADGDGEIDLTKEVEVTIDGEPTKVPLKEALEGYIRTQTFHKRMNEVNDLKKVVEGEAADVSKARDVYGNMLVALKEQLDSLTPDEPDWDTEFEKDPVSASRLQHQWNKFKGQRAAIEQERVRVAQEQQQERIKEVNKYAAQERQKMLERRPEWKDEKVWGKDRASMQRTAKSLGFTDQEVNGILDSRYMEVLLRASKYDRMMANKPKPVQNGPKPLRPGAGASRTAPKGSTKASSRLAKTGSLRDAADFFKTQL